MVDKKLRRKKVIHVANLPRNITFADIKALAGNKEASNIKNIVHEYDRYLRPVGRSYIEFLDEDVALQFFIKNSERTIVGHKLSLRFVQTPKDGISKYQHPQIGSSSGRMVLIFGFPSFFSAERAKTYLDLQFELIDTILPSVQTFTYPGLKSASGQSMKRAFIVQAATEAEAHRMVRKLHNFQMWKNNLSWPHFLKARVLE
ncbi:hypothetical protein H4219_004345 [Mycoemilia scoparia]|uniref:RRM domain-containing protein n=1 Tax=Mycoemilia scoparia TaxID=417184 RepID=A0A9W8DRJ7_9FUNG|nr:hypothetical protein H4219_004345 [Mycoemilia scoparia]